MTQNTRLGLKFVLLYAAVYLAFVLINAFAPSMMEQTPVAGVNLAVISGFGLIAFAFLLALIYGVLCGIKDRDANSDRSRGP